MKTLPRHPEAAALVVLHKLLVIGFRCVYGRELYVLATGPRCSRATDARPNGAPTRQPRATPWDLEDYDPVALKGRNGAGLNLPRIVAPLQGSCVRRIADPGRCPGLACCRPFRAMRDPRKWHRSRGANSPAAKATLTEF